jgi:hypothetical protein
MNVIVDFRLRGENFAFDLEVLDGAVLSMDAKAD